MKVDPGGVEGAPHIQPVGRPDNPFVAKAQHLAVSDEVKPAFGGAANLGIGFAKIPNVLVGRRGGNMVIEKDSRILRHRNQLQPASGLNVDVNAELGEIIRVVNGGVTDSIPRRSVDACDSPGVSGWNGSVEGGVEC